MTMLEGLLEHITYFNEESYYTIAKFRPSNAGNFLTIVGVMPGVHPGQALKIQGDWETHPKYGQQFKIHAFEVRLPSAVEDIGKYLASGVIKGIGPLMAEKLVGHFGADTLKIIEKNPENLLDVAGIGKVRAELISNAWSAHHALRGVMHFLQAHGVKTSLSARLFKLYGSDTVSIIRNDPFCLAKDIPGTGFYIADTIAQHMGTPTNDPQRIRACILHILQRFSDEGHVFVHADRLLKRCNNLFRIALDAARDILTVLVASEEVVIEDIDGNPDDSAVYLKELYEAENGISKKIGALLSVPSMLPDIESEQISEEVLRRLAIQLSSEQMKVVEQIFSHKVVIITGGPGTGKTTLIQSMNTVLESLGKRALLAAPTGRAARRLSEVTRREAKTIHRLLGYNYSDNLFSKNRDNPLDADVVIIDEASMVDTVLMNHLLKAVPMKSSLILIGDVFQLPSVGPGNVLSDMIKSDRIPVFYLKKVFRQAQKSAIVLNAHRVRQGKPPAIEKVNDINENSEFYFLEQGDPSEIVKIIIDFCKKIIPQRFGFDPIQEIQVLTPMHRGVLGTINLNQVLQKALNKSSDEIAIRGSCFKMGDKVMHLKNNYQKDVYNGDIGTISSIDRNRRKLSVSYYGRDVSYDFTETNEISPAYSISVHKSQGSEYPAVIVPITTQHLALLQRNLLYTAMTRGKKLVILVGTKKALAIALKNNKPQKRLSGLASRLMDM